MAKLLTLIILFLFFLFLPLSAITSAAVISGPEITFRDNDIIVSTGLDYLGELETAIELGIEKGIVFTIELFRDWKFWPDEFVVSKKVKRIIKYDKLRGEYLVFSNDGTSRVKSSFKDFNSMKELAFRVSDLNLASILELEPGSYYLRVVAESKSRKLPPVIGLLMFFIPEADMSLAKESQTFIVGDKR